MRNEEKASLNKKNALIYLRQFKLKGYKTPKML